ncbi:hypothetical protein [Lacipirellula sp.]|uniref:hypothetical protein n=1 Tax=Lacipirellula sp. TaxID=2691419 RepID=UPI003D0A9155
MDAFESPLERLFHDQLLKRLPRGVSIQPQVEVQTLCGKFRLDFMVEVGGRRVGLECDGKEFHDEWRDEWRDAMILGDNQADEIIRFRGCDLTYHLDDCMYLLAHLQPLLFADRQRIVIEKLASDRVKEFVAGGNLHPTMTMLTYGCINGSGGPDFIIIMRRSREGLTTSVGREFWAVLHRRAVEAGGGSLDAIMKADAEETRLSWTAP